MQVLDLNVCFRTICGKRDVRRNCPIYRAVIHIMEYVTINGYGVSLDIDDADFKDSKLNKAWTELVTNQFACEVYNVGNVNIYVPKQQEFKGESKKASLIH